MSQLLQKARDHFNEKRKELVKIDILELGEAVYVRTCEPAKLSDDIQAMANKNDRGGGDAAQVVASIICRARDAKGDNVFMDKHFNELLRNVDSALLVNIGVKINEALNSNNVSVEDAEKNS